MGTLKEYLGRVPDFSALSKQPRRLAPFLMLYAELEDDSVVSTARTLSALYEDARVKAPANISDVLRKSSSFVRTQNGGYRLSHDAHERALNSLLPTSRESGARTIPDTHQSATRPNADAPQIGQQVLAQPSVRDVLVVYGRDERLRKELFNLLRALNLNPLEFEEMVQRTGSTSPFTLDVIKTAFTYVQACVVLFSPDESVTLRPELQSADDESEAEFQPRPNVLVEAGMALALYAQRTILVRVGKVRKLSDLEGIQYVTLNDTSSSRNKLATRLESAGCEISRTGADWLSTGKFGI